MNILSQLHFFYSRKISQGFKIDKDALVVDIGSGEKPFWRADVFVDRLSLGNVQRASKFNTIHDIGIFIDSDANKMPFKDNVFDFSFASHLLEHVQDPGGVIAEIVRISKSGYIEVPNGIIETIKPFDSHLWFVFVDKNKLIFVRKSKKLHKALLTNGKNYNNLIDKVDNPFIRLYWKKRIDYEIIDDLKKEDRFESAVGDSKNSASSSYNWHILIVKILRLLFYKSKATDRLQKALSK